MKTSNKQLRCALIFVGPFPIGNVSTLRIMSYCKALAKRDVFVKVLIIAPSKEAAVNNSKTGIVDGVHYQYITNVTWKSENTPTIIKFCYYIFGILYSIKYIQKDKINCLLSYHNEILSNFFFSAIAKLKGIPYIIDKTEYPRNYFGLSSFQKKMEKFKLKLHDGIITITEELGNFYEQIIGFKKKNIFLLPMTINSDRYNGLAKQITFPYVAVVFGTHNRDGLFNSIRAYHKYLINSQGTAMNLVLIGDYDGLCLEFPENKEIKQYIEMNSLEQSIIFKGLVPINDVPQILLNAKCLLTTPAEYVSGGFPTKLGEYLLSGVPVILTSAGEIPNYLTHKVNAFLSSPLDIDDIAKNLLYVEQNYNHATTIGRNGQELAKKSFNADTYSENMIDYLRTFNSNHPK